MNKQKKALNTQERKREQSKDRNHSGRNPGNTRQEDQITNEDKQKEIVNEPNYKTDREEESSEEQ